VFAVTCVTPLPPIERIASAMDVPLVGHHLNLRRNFTTIS